VGCGCGSVGLGALALWLEVWVFGDLFVCSGFSKVVIPPDEEPNKKDKLASASEKKNWTVGDNRIKASRTFATDQHTRPAVGCTNRCGRREGLGEGTFAVVLRLVCRRKKG
jgi:hypothetical protein